MGSVGIEQCQVISIKGLNESEASAFSTFRQLCAEQGLLKKPQGLSKDDVSDGINDDIALLRFLQARKMSPSDALKQFKDAAAFHSEKNVLRLFDLICVEDYEDTRSMYPHWTGRRDKNGYPIMILDAGHLNPTTMAHWRKTRDSPVVKHGTTTDMKQRASIHFDTLTRFIFPLCSAAQDRPDSGLPVTKSTYLVDGTTVSLKQGWDVRDFAQDISWILATCYPETIDHIFVCNVPSYFSMIWNIVKKLVDPATAEKIVILRPSDVYPGLEKYIDRKNIPTKFGGDFPFKNGMLPDLDAGVCQALDWTNAAEGKLPRGPLKWIEDSTGKRKVVATGSVDGVQRTEEVAVLKNQA
ncbi:hypothetical protein MW887_000830 [Aspergillus wentii]|nr:hypothetical protein MW887_000830 [Aspergillus wentii]